MSRLLNALSDLDARKRLSGELSLETDTTDSSVHKPFEEIPFPSMEDEIPVKETQSNQFKDHQPKEHPPHTAKIKGKQPLSKMLPVLMILTLVAAAFWWRPLWPTLPELKQTVSTHIPYLASWLGSPAAKPVPPPAVVLADKPSVPATLAATGASSPKESQPQVITVQQPKPEPTLLFTQASPIPPGTPGIEAMLADKALDFFLPNANDKPITPKQHHPDVSSEEKQPKLSADALPQPATVKSPTGKSAHPDTSKQAGKQRDHSAGIRNQASHPDPQDEKSIQQPPSPATKANAKAPTPPPEGITLESEEHAKSLQALILARRALASGDIFQADAQLAKVDISMREESDYLGTLAALETRRGAAHRSIGLYQQLTLRNPLLSQWWLGLAIAHDRMNHGSEALRAYRRTLHDVNLTHEAMDFILGRITILERNGY